MEDDGHGGGPITGLRHDYEVWVGEAGTRSQENDNFSST